MYFVDVMLYLQMYNTSNITAIDLSIDIAIGIHSVERGESLKYELWHFVGGANLAQNLRLRNHCHFHKDLL